MQRAGLGISMPSLKRIRIKFGENQVMIHQGALMKINIPFLQLRPHVTLKEAWNAFSEILQIPR